MLADQADTDIRDYAKKVHGFEMEFEDTLDKLNKANEAFEEKDKTHKEVEGDIAALTRRIMLMEEEAKKADEVMKKVKIVESKCMNNEVTLEELDKNLRP